MIEALLFSLIGAVLTVVIEVVIFYLLVIHEDKQVDKADKERLISEIVKRGFKDVTNANPIHFIEMFTDESFTTMYAYSYRFAKEESGFKYILLFAFYYNRIDVECKVVYNDGFKKFHLHGYLPNWFSFVNLIEYNIEAIKTILNFITNNNK